MESNINDVIRQFSKIFAEVLDEDEIELSAETTADDIEEWDSLTHIQLIVAIEKHFDIKFKAMEIEQYRNVGDMCKGVSDKLAAAK